MTPDAAVLITTAPEGDQQGWSMVKVGSLLAFCSPDCVGPEIGQVLGAYRAIENTGQECKKIVLYGHPTHTLTTESTRRRR